MSFTAFPECRPTTKGVCVCVHARKKKRNATFSKCWLVKLIVIVISKSDWPRDSGRQGWQLLKKSGYGQVRSGVGELTGRANEGEVRRWPYYRVHQYFPPTLCCLSVSLYGKYSHRAWCEILIFFTWKKEYLTSHSELFILKLDFVLSNLEKVLH